MVAAVDGSGRAEPFTASRGNFGDPRVSPDGGRIAYVASGPGDEPARIWVLDLGSGLARPVTPSVEAASAPRRPSLPALRCHCAVFLCSKRMAKYCSLSLGVRSK